MYQEKKFKSFAKAKQWLKTNKVVGDIVFTEGNMPFVVEYKPLVSPAKYPGEF